MAGGEYEFTHGEGGWVSNADVDFSYIFRHGGKLYRITIPRETKVDLDASKYEGPLLVGRLLGTTQVIE